MHDPLIGSDRKGAEVPVNITWSIVRRPAYFRILYSFQISLESMF